MRHVLLVVPVLLLSGPVAAQTTPATAPAAPLSEQAIAAAELRQQADRWRVAGNLAIDAAIALSVGSLVYADDLKDHPRIEQRIVYGIAGGMATWAVSGWMMRKLRREADLLDSVTVTPEPGGAAVRGSLSW